jgi:hypothetical protein
MWDTYLSALPNWLCCSARILCSACAASSSAQLTEDVSLRRTSGSVRAFPSAVESFPIPETNVRIGKAIAKGKCLKPKACILHFLEPLPCSNCLMDLPFDFGTSFN